MEVLPWSLKTLNTYFLMSTHKNSPNDMGIQSRVVLKVTLSTAFSIFYGFCSLEKLCVIYSLMWFFKVCYKPPGLLSLTFSLIRELVPGFGAAGMGRELGRHFKDCNNLSCFRDHPGNLQVTNLALAMNASQSMEQWDQFLNKPFLWKLN